MTLPKFWKRVNISQFHKYKSRIEFKNYRSVSLTCVPFEILEKIIRIEMVEHLIEICLLRFEQHVFMPHKSCSTNLIENLDIITDALNEGKFIDIICTDFSNAFHKNKPYIIM